MNTRGNKLTGGLLLVLLLTFTGCTTAPLQTADILPQSLTTWRHIPSSVKVTASGGKATHAYGETEISTGVFINTVKQSIQMMGLFQSIVEENPDYQLNIIFKVPQVSDGFTMESTMTAYWQLINPETGNIGWQTLVETSHSAGVGDSWSGVKRLRMVKSKAAMKNIETALGRLETSDFVESEKELIEISNRWKKDRKKEDFDYLFEHIIVSATQVHVRRVEGPGVSKSIVSRRYFLRRISKQDVESLLGPVPENSRFEFENGKVIYSFIFDSAGILNSISFER